MRQKVEKGSYGGQKHRNSEESRCIPFGKEHRDDDDADDDADK